MESRRMVGESLHGLLASAGYADAWRVEHPAGVEEPDAPTWQGRSWGRPSALRLDAAYLSPVLGPRFEGIAHDRTPLAEGVSDHAAVVIRLRAEPGEPGTADAG